MTKRVTDITADPYADFDLTNDAKFESMRSYPRGKEIYHAHIDISKDLERKAKFFKRYQKLMNAETDRQIHKVERRFINILKHTYDCTQTRTRALRLTYNKWASRNQPGAEFDTIFDGSISAMMSSNNELYHENRGTPLAKYESRGRIVLRVPSRRSVSCDIIPRAAGGRKLGTLRSSTNVGNTILQPTMTRHFRTVSTMALTPVKDSAAMGTPLPLPEVEQKL